MDNKIITLVLGSIGIFAAIYLAVIYGTEAIFGDLTETESYKPLTIILPAMGAVVFVLWRMNRNK